MHPEMPRSVMEYIKPDYVAPAAELGALIGRLVHEPALPDHAMHAGRAGYCHVITGEVAARVELPMVPVQLAI